MNRRIAAAHLLAALVALVALVARTPLALAEGEAKSAALAFPATNLPLAEILAKAKPGKRLVMLDVVTEQCAWCRALERDTFGAAEVAKALDGYVIARYDAGQDRGREVADRFRVRAYPTVLFTDAEGAELDRVVGYLPPAQFVAEAERIRRGVGTLPALAASHAKDPASLGISAAYGRKLVRAGDYATAEPLLRAVVDAQPADPEARPSALEGLAELALARFDTRAAHACYARITDEHPTSEAAADAWISRVQIRAREGTVGAALTEVARARDMVKSAEKVMILEQLAFRLHRQEMEASLVRWGEKADLAGDVESLHAAARAALEAHVALGTATRWAEHAVELSRRDPATLDTLARLLVEGGDLARAIGLEAEALAATKDVDVRAALAARLAAFQAALRVPPSAPGPGMPATPDPSAGTSTPADREGRPSGECPPVPAPTGPCK